MHKFGRCGFYAAMVPLSLAKLPGGGKDQKPIGMATRTRLSSIRSNHNKCKQNAVTGNGKAVFVCIYSDSNLINLIRLGLQLGIEKRPLGEGQRLFGYR